MIPLREHIAREYKLDFELDSVDVEILVRITKGYSSPSSGSGSSGSSPYSVWASMKKDAKTKSLDTTKKIMTYKNINKRVVKLANLGVIEEIKPDAYTVNLHGRKDYKLTIKGLPYLVHHVIVFPQDLESIKEHLDKIGLDRKILAKLLTDYSNAAIYTADKYRQLIRLPSVTKYEHKDGRYTRYVSTTPTTKKKL
jgi:hypothetical protein